LGLRKNKANSKPICRPWAGNPKHKTRNPKRFEKVRLKKQSQFISVQCSAFSGLRYDMRKSNLKKQSQFTEGQNGVMPVISMFYGDFGLRGRRKNKAKQSQSKHVLSAVEWANF